ncbi:MAG: phosphotransferase [Oscillospiraceae bacterium]
MCFDYIIVQAGGKGTRMDKLTRNKPKALVPVYNLPIIFHLFRKYPQKKFIIIGDYKYDVLKRYLEAFADVEYELVNACGKSGTCAGLREAIGKVAPNSPFMLIWSDLVLDNSLSFDSLDTADYVGLSGDFKCRWKFENGVFEEQASYEYGVSGLFLFKDNSFAEDLPESGEFVRWLSQKGLDFGTVRLSGAKEYGLISEYNKISIPKCRPFNKIIVDDNKIVKTGIDEQGKALAVREKAWYRKAQSLGFEGIPHIYSFEPLTMELIDGKNIYEYSGLSLDEKKSVINKLVAFLKQLHSYESAPYDDESYYDAYIGKTFSRLDKIRGLVPFADRPVININGINCRNVFFCREELEKMFEAFKPQKFVFIHGDCTFSNLLLKHDSEPVMIDPRGYFGKTELYGDAAYDWAKLYYSVVGNYDLFNLKQFDLKINENGVELDIASSGWEALGDHFLDLVSDEVSPEQIKAIHAIIWLSLTTYAWEDYDSICAAFYNGLLLLEKLQ